jgi:hypothetical protein
MLVLMYQTAISNKPTILRHHHTRHCITSTNTATVLTTDYELNGREIMVKFPGRANRPLHSGRIDSGAHQLHIVCVQGGSFLEEMATGE